MPAYTFETITASQALSLGPLDTVTVGSGTASQTSVIFDSDDRPAISIAGRTVLFAARITELFDIFAPQFVFGDGSLLYVGDTTVNQIAFPFAEGQVGGAIYAGGANDVVVTLSGSWLVQGNTGADTIRLAGGRNTVYGGQDADIISLTGGGGNFVQGNKGDDSVGGSAGLDTILGGQGNDILNGYGGADFLNGNLGNDVVTGSGTLLGEGGDDSLTGGYDSTLRGGEGDDTLRYTIIDDGQHTTAFATAFGEDGNDTIIVENPFSDTLSGGTGDDLIISSTNAANQGDTLDGEDGDDRLAARGGSNLLRGGAGSDNLSGGDGADTLDSGVGADTMQGGDGADVFVLTAGSTPSVFPNQVADRILDWSALDHIQLRAPGAVGYTEITAVDPVAAASAAQALLAGGQVEVVAVQVDADVILFADGSGANTTFATWYLVGRTLADISGGNFL